MKVAVYIFAATCLINGLTAADLLAFDKNTDSEDFGSNFLNAVVPDDDNVKEPSPNVIFPSWPSTISTTRGTTTLRPSTEIPTSPFPTTTTSRRPHPPPPPPPPAPGKNSQIYNNRISAMGPFAGRLINIVLNKGGKQKTIQKNQLLYDIKSAGTDSKYLEEKSNE